MSLPQAFRNMLPVLLTQTIVLFQDTSLVYVLSIPDFLGAASKCRAARRVAGRDVSVRGRGLFFDFIRGLLGIRAFRPHQLRPLADLHDRDQPRRQMVRAGFQALKIAPPASPRARGGGGPSGLGK
jgi:hypothetical protein